MQITCTDLLISITFLRVVTQSLDITLKIGMYLNYDFIIDTHSSCKFVRPWKRPPGNSAILLPYKTLQTNISRLLLSVQLILEKYYFYCIEERIEYIQRLEGFQSVKSVGCYFFDLVVTQITAGGNIQKH